MGSWTRPGHVLYKTGPVIHGPCMPAARLGEAKEGQRLESTDLLLATKMVFPKLNCKAQDLRE